MKGLVSNATVSSKDIIKRLFRVAHQRPSLLGPRLYQLPEITKYFHLLSKMIYIWILILFGIKTVSSLYILTRKIVC